MIRNSSLRGARYGHDNVTTMFLHTFTYGNLHGFACCAHKETLAWTFPMAAQQMTW